MPLSEIAQKALDDSARINAEQEKKKRDQEAKQEQERKIAEAQYNAYIAEQTQIQNQIITLENKEKAYVQQLEAEQKEYELALADYNANKLIEEQAIAQQQAEEKAIIDQIEAKKQADQTARDQIYIDLENKLKPIYAERDAEIANLIEYNPPHITTRDQLTSLTNEVKRRFGYAISGAEREAEQARDRLEFNIKYPGAVLGGSATRTYEKSGRSIPLIQLYESQQAKFKANQEAQRAHAIAISQSQLDADHAKWNNIVAEFSQAKEEQDKQINVYFNSTPTKAGDLLPKSSPPVRILHQPLPDEIIPNIKALESYKQTQQAKADKLKEVLETRKKPEPITPRQPTTKSNAFLTKAPVYATSILGTDNNKSQKALATFQETQKQQKELFEKITKAKNPQEATRLKEEYQKLNPYVGTPQTASTKKGFAQQGVLIDLKADKKKDTIPPLDSTIEEPKLSPQGITETNTIYDITLGDRTVTVKNEETANKILERLNRPKEISNPEYQFIDKENKKYAPTVAELFSFNNYLINQAPQMPTQADKEFNKLLQEQPQAFDLDPSHVNDPSFSGDVQTPAVYAYNVAKEDPLNRGIMSPIDNPGETVVGKGIEDIIAVGSSTVYNKPLPENSQLISFVDTKLKTEEGQKLLLGEAIGEYTLLRVFSGAPQIITKAYHAGFTSPKTLKIAEEIAERIRIAGRDPETEKLISKFPNMPESMKVKMRNLANKETVGIEMLDPKTALIKRGTELGEVQTPYIVVKNTGKKAHGALYETYTAEKPGAYSKILISGEQKSELTGGIKQTKDITQYPATRDNIIKSQDVSKLATVGTSEKVGLEGLKDTPLAVIKKIETQEIKTGSIIMETERLNKIKSMNIDSGAKNLAKGEKNTDWTKPQTQTKPTAPTQTKPTETVIKIDTTLPKNKGTSDFTVMEGSASATQKREKLEKIIRETSKEPINVKLDSINKLSSISLGASSQGVNSIQGTGAKLNQQTAQNQPLKTKVDQKLETASKLRTSQITELNLNLEQLTKTRPSLDPKYSLITEPGLREKVNQVPIVGEKLKEKLITTQTFQFELKEPLIPLIPQIRKTITTTVTPPSPILLDERKQPKSNNRKGKLKISYYRYNVNTESVGRYIAQAPDISTGKTRKIIDKIDRLERKINTPQYQRKQGRKEERAFKKSLIPTRKSTKGSLSSRGYIPNITEPKGKKARKALKKLGFSLNF